MDPANGHISSLLFIRTEERGLEYNTIIEADVPRRLQGDPGRIRQILLNLAGNAIKFTLQGEVRVRVSIAEQAESRLLLRFAVTDTGVGIAPDALEGLFVPFQQADSSTTRRFGGTLLGLTISKRLAELMGGAVGVETTERSISGPRRSSAVTSATASWRPAKSSMPKDDMIRLRQMLVRSRPGVGHGKSGHPSSDRAAGGSCAWRSLNAPLF